MSCCSSCFLLNFPFLSRETICARNAARRRDLFGKMFIDGGIQRRAKDVLFCSRSDVDFEELLKVSAFIVR